MSEPDGTTETRQIAATVHGRFLVRPPRAGHASQWLVGFHGYAQSADVFLEMLCRIPQAEDWRVVSVQALHPFYGRANEVVANWMTRQDREHAIADNVAYVDAVVAELERELGPPARLVFAGFSQGVAMAYRAAVAGRHRADAVLAVAGDVPPELLSGGPRTWPHVRIVVGFGETYYTPAVVNRDVERLRSVGVEPRVVRFEGGHEWTREVVEAAGALLTEVAAG